ncbi:unnamed protein product [Clonostachys byssicola]|uniref:mRNA 3'-end-processing protein RNA14 n=1 Tax=Clonostachys byssicola TaxID=160290 RepID=A0A9N9UP05_9HYPO|nr:unnamed protein product [Clonostachys byssicola]
MHSETPTWEEGRYPGAEGENVQQNEHLADAAVENSHAPGEAEDSGSEDGGDYDPESVTLDSAPVQTVETVPLVSSQRAATKPKMSGGFIVEASEDEEDDQEPQPVAGYKTEQPDPRQSATISNESPQAPAANELPQPRIPPVIAGLDPVALLEARIKEDPRGDMDAWQNLMADYKRRNDIEGLRKIYTRFVEVFPQAADIWADWLEMELSLDQFAVAEQLFGRSLMTVPNVRLWTVYLNYIRRRNDLTNDTTGTARQTIARSYEFVIDNIGMDRDSGNIWQDYIQFLKNGPGQVGGTGWQDQQKMDQLRKAYHRAINVPMSTVNNLWKEYDQFEMGLNKMTGRKFIQERSPGYMSAKSANIALDNITRNIKRSNLPRLPPAPGFDGDQEFREQVELWKKWIAWEKEDPLVLATDEPKAFKQRVMYCYKQALMALRFWPEIWVDAAQWCFQNDIREMDKETGTEMLLQGIQANPESVLLALKHADHIELNYPAKEGDTAEYAKAVRKPFDDVLDTLYAMGDKVKEREKMEVATLKQAAAHDAPIAPSIEPNDDDDEQGQPKKSAIEGRISAIQEGYSAESQLLSRTISHVWIALARVMRRIQGKGSLAAGGLRKVFTDARQRGRLTSDVYVAVALLESVVYKDPVGAKIFERGARLFPSDENFMLEYLKFLHAKDDTTNARVVFETCVTRLISKPETMHKAKPLYAYFHKYESQFGELSQISKLEDRMAELFPGDPKLNYFTSRYSTEKFDPIAAPIIISKAVQMRPRQVLPTIEQPPISARNSPAPLHQEQSPRLQYVRATASPKRPLGIDEEELNPAKRVARAASPLKGAAGRRLDQQRRNQSSALNREITFLLGILPPAHTYDGQRFSPQGLTALLQSTTLPDYNSWSSRSGDQNRQGTPGHGRHASGDIMGRPISPYGRVASASGGYRNSPLRTENSSGHPANPYAPPPSDPTVAGMQPGWPGQGGYLQSSAGQYGGYRY